MGRLKTILNLTVQAKKQPVSMQRRLMLYWACLLVGFAAALILLLNLTGVFVTQEKYAGAALQMQLNHVSQQLTRHLESVTARSISLSEDISHRLGSLLTSNGLTPRDLNDNPALLYELQQSLFDELYTTLQMSDCSGAYLMFDATTNTKSQVAHRSASGLYLRYANLSTSDNARQDVVLYRGIPEISRLRQMELHNRWNLEFDTDAFPGYDSWPGTRVSRLAGAARWTVRFRLPDTWEDVYLLCVPVLDQSGSVCGLCGVELSTLYCYLSYPEAESPYGPMVTTLSPYAPDTLLVGQGMVGGADGTLLGGTERLEIQEGKYFNRYTCDSATYIGLQQKIPVLSGTGSPLIASVLIPKSTYDAYCGASRSHWVLGCLLLALLMWLLSVILSRRFVRPIVDTIHAIQNEECPDGSHTGISELDALMTFIRSKSQEQSLHAGSLPPNIEELFHTFAENAKTLSTAERGILQYYIDGHEITEIPSLAFVSIHTVKKHNSNIYQKLGVTSRDELMLYIELFRRCNRLNELTDPPAP